MLKWAQIWAILPFALPAISMADNWKSYKYPELGFAIELPSPPEVLQRPIATGGGRCPSTILTLAHDSINTFQLTVVDCSALPMSGEVLGDLESHRRGAARVARDVGAEITAETDVNIQGAKGQQYTGKNPTKGYPFKCLILVSGKRIYQVIAIGSLPDLKREVKSLTFRVK
jgi:hypothetical protein